MYQHQIVCQYRHLLCHRNLSKLEVGNEEEDESAEEFIEGPINEFLKWRPCDLVDGDDERICNDSPDERRHRGGRQVPWYARPFVTASDLFGKFVSNQIDGHTWLGMGVVGQLRLG